MTTLAQAPAPLANSPPLQRSSSPRRHAAIPPPRPFSQSRMSSVGSREAHTSTNNSKPGSSPAAPARSSPHSNDSPGIKPRSPPSAGKASPNASRPPTIRVKKEPASPTMAARHRPKRLDLSASGSALRGPQTAGANPKDSGGLAIKDLGVACLSPGFQTQDPQLNEKLQRSWSVRDQQRQLIEARQKGQTKPLTSHEQIDSAREVPQTSKRKGPPPGLSVHTPAASAFAHERVIQSAPLHHTFTGLQPHNAHPQGPSRLAQPQHAAPGQPAHRLPSISDVFAHDRAEPTPPSGSFRPATGPAHSPSHPPPVFSPGYPPQHPQHPQHQQQPQQHTSQQQQPPPPQPLSSRSREFRSAEEAVQGMSGGREELLPKIVHYSSNQQPPSPPSPGAAHHQQHPSSSHGHSYAHEQHPREHHTAAAPHHHHHHQQQQQQQPQQHPSQQRHASSHFHDARPDFGRTQSLSGRRRTRDEYERDNGDPAALQYYHADPKRQQHAPQHDQHYQRGDEADWRSGLSSREKKDEFLKLCERAWDLFHS